MVTKCLLCKATVLRSFKRETRGNMLVSSSAGCSVLLLSKERIDNFILDYFEH